MQPADEGARGQFGAIVIPPPRLAGQRAVGD